MFWFDILQMSGTPKTHSKVNLNKAWGLNFSLKTFHWVCEGETAWRLVHLHETTPTVMAAVECSVTKKKKKKDTFGVSPRKFTESFLLSPSKPENTARNYPALEPFFSAFNHRNFPQTYQDGVQEENRADLSYLCNSNSGFKQKGGKDSKPAAIMSTICSFSQSAKHLPQGKFGVEITRYLESMFQFLKMLLPWGIFMMWRTSNYNNNMTPVSMKCTDATHNHSNIKDPLQSHTRVSVTHCKWKYWEQAWIKLSLWFWSERILHSAIYERLCTDI